MRGLSLRFGLGRGSRRSHGHQFWALLCRFRCRLLLAEIPTGVDRSSELNRDFSCGIGTISNLISQSSGSASLWTVSQNTKKVAATDRRAARETSLCLDSRRIHKQSHEGIGRWCCAGLSGLSQELDHSPHSAEFGHWNSSHQRGVCRCGPNRLVWRATQTGAERDEGGRSKTGISSLLHVKLPPMSAPRPPTERQEHLDAIVSFAGAGQRRRLFRALTFSRSSG